MDDGSSFRLAAPRPALLLGRRSHTLGRGSHLRLLLQRLVPARQRELVARRCESGRRLQQLLGDAVSQARRITLENLSPDEVLGFYYQIDYTLTEVPEDRAYFHSQWRRSNPVSYEEAHTLLGGVKGVGHYVGAYLAWGVNNNGWWGEGR